MSRGAFQSICLALITMILLGWVVVWGANWYFARIEAEQAMKEQRALEIEAMHRKWDAELAEIEWKNIERKAKTETLKKAIERAKSLQD